MSNLNSFARYGIWAKTIAKALGFMTGATGSALGKVNWKNLVTSTLAVLVVVLIAFRFFFPTMWDVWAWSWVFWFSLLLFILAYLSFNIGRSINGIFFLVIGLAMSAKYIIEKIPNKTDKRTANIAEAQKFVVSPDTTTREVKNFLETTLEPHEKYQVILPSKNCEVVVEMANFKQVISTDDRGFKYVKTLTPGDPSNNKPGKIIFTHTKGQGVPSVKFW